MAAANKDLSPTLLSRIAEAIANIRYGTVHITIHDSQVVQIEQTEKIRVSPDADLTTGGRQDTWLRADRTTGGSQTEDGR